MQDKERSDNRYAAAKSITKRLGALPDADRLVVLTHVATELGYTLVPLPNSNRTAPAPTPPKAA